MHIFINIEMGRKRERERESGDEATCTVHKKKIGVIAHRFNPRVLICVYD
jgi:hypothetical protein